MAAPDDKERRARASKGGTAPNAPSDRGRRQTRTEANSEERRSDNRTDDPWLEAPAEGGDPWNQARFTKHSARANYDKELETLIRVAAKAGLAQGPENAVNYTTLLIGFAFCDDAASRFLQSSSLFRRTELLASRRLKVDDNAERRFVHLATTEPFPPAENLYSTSAVQMLDLAADIANDVAKETSAAIGTRHLLAAFLFRSPDNHAEDLRRWGLDAQDFAVTFPRFIEEHWPREREGWPSLHRVLGMRTAGTQAGDPTNRPGQTGTVAEKVAAEDAAAASVQRARYVASFGADDPSVQRRDLLDVRDEARAFARIAASRNTQLPLSVGVFGEWGSGKTFFMGLMSEHVEKLSNDAASKAEESLFLPDIVQIKFNAWHYIETNLWASLVEYIFSELDRKLEGQKPREQVDRLFEQLSTSRLLKTEAIEELIVKRRERKKAEERLDAARRDYEAALLRQSAVTSTQFWRAVFDTFTQKLREGETAKVKALAKALGLKELSESRGSLNEVLKEAETEAGRARVLNRAMVAKLGQARWIAAIVLALIVVPAAVVLLKDGLALFLNADWLGQVNNTVLALSGMVATAGALIGKVVASARSALTELEGFRNTLDAAVKERTEDFKTNSGEARTFAEAEREIARFRSELEQAERKFAEADKRYDEVLRNYHSATARGRLNSFIRDKLASGDYAKHLGLIATIRKDFEQLAQLMADTKQDNESHKKYLRELEDYRKHLSGMLRLAQEEGTVSPQEAAELGKDDAVPEPGLFTRMILYIDDLDRCPADKVVDVLQAIHLLLYFPLFVVVVAVDARWVSRSLREQFPQLLTENISAPWRKLPLGPRPGGDEERSDQQKEDAGGAEPAGRRHGQVPIGATSHDYLEKIFQVPYWVRPMDANASMKYVRGIAAPKPQRGTAPAAASEGDRPAVPAPNSMGPSSGPGAGVTAGGGPVPSSIPSAASVLPSAQAAAADTREEDETEEQAAYAAKSMVLTAEEGKFLEALAPFVGSTPRRGLRFVNIYRLVKTSLSETLQNELQEGSNHLSYRALVTQLAIVTGAPHIAWSYFQLLENAALAIATPESVPPALKGQQKIETLAALCEQLRVELAAVEGSQKAALLGALEKLRALNQKDCFDTGTQVLMTLHGLAPIARRYSFTARPH